MDPIILGEIYIGVLSLPAGRKRTQLEQWFNDVVATIECISWDAATGRRWAQLTSQLTKRGSLMPMRDSMIAATALRYDLTVATRNTRDFKAAGVKVIDPFL